MDAHRANKPAYGQEQKDAMNRINNSISSVSAHLLESTGTTTQGNTTASVIQINQEETLKNWVIADDVVMGGKSSSNFSVETDEKDQSLHISWKGTTSL